MMWDCMKNTAGVLNKKIREKLKENKKKSDILIKMSTVLILWCWLI